MAGQKISGAQNLSGWSKFPPGHRALGLQKLGLGAAPQLRLGLPNQRARSVFAAGAAHLGRPGTARWGHRALQEIKRTFGYAVGAGVLTRPSRAVFHSWAGRPVSGPYRKANALPDMP